MSGLRVTGRGVGAVWGMTEGVWGCPQFSTGLLPTG